MIDPYEHIFETRENSPGWWLNKSSDLHASAGALWLSMHRTEKDDDALKLGFRKGFDMGVACWPIYQMLFGMALELLFKAIIVLKNEKPDTIHDLGKLSVDAGIVLSDEELNILKILTESIVWDGRYPTPKTRESLKKHYIHSDKVIRESNNPYFLDWNDLNKIWSKGLEIFTTAEKGRSQGPSAIP